MRILLLALPCALLLLAAIMLPWRSWLQLPPTAPTPQSSALHDTPLESVDGAAQTLDDIDALVTELVALLKGDYSERAHSIVFQVSLKNMRDDLLRDFPRRGEEIFSRVIRQAFPQWADAIYLAIQTMEQYESWLLENSAELNNMNALAHRGALWEKRRELFGDDAELLWSRELDEEQQRVENLQQTVALLDRAHDTPLQDRLTLFRESFERNFSGTVPGQVLDSRGVMAQVFFGFDSVQRDLAGLPPGQRQEKIDQLRRDMGFETEAVEELAQRDQSREAKWQQGYAYMEQRAELVDSLQGNALETALDELRVEHFGEAAHTIKREEEDLGLFRFERPRVYGRN